MTHDSLAYRIHKSFLNYWLPCRLAATLSANWGTQKWSKLLKRSSIPGSLGARPCHLRPVLWTLGAGSSVGSANGRFPWWIFGCQPGNHFLGLVNEGFVNPGHWPHWNKASWDVKTRGFSFDRHVFFSGWLLVLTQWYLFVFWTWGGSWKIYRGSCSMLQHADRTIICGTQRLKSPTWVIAHELIPVTQSWCVSYHFAIGHMGFHLVMPPYTATRFTRYAMRI